MHISRREFIVVSATGAVSVGAAACGRSRDETVSESQPGAKAMTRLSVLVSGLVGSVSTSEATHLLLLDGAKTQSGPHAARLVAPAASVAKDSAGPSGTDKGQSFWDLTNHQLTLVSGATTGPTRVTGLRRPGEEHKPTDVNSHKDVTWVAQMTKIPAAGNGRINSGCLAGDPRPSKVASRVRFNGGEVAARFRPPFHQVIWDIGQAGSPNLLKQVLAEISVSQNIPADRVVFRLEPFDGSAAAREIVLTPASGTDLEVVVENLPSPEHPCKSHAETSTLTHFAAFYQLLAQTPTSTPVPTCTGSNCPQCPSQTEVVYCPPVDYGP